MDITYKTPLRKRHLPSLYNISYFTSKLFDIVTWLKSNKIQSYTTQRRIRANRDYSTPRVSIKLQAVPNCLLCCVRNDTKLINIKMCNALSDNWWFHSRGPMLRPNSIKYLLATLFILFMGLETSPFPHFLWSVTHFTHPYKKSSLNWANW